MPQFKPLNMLNVQFARVFLSWPNWALLLETNENTHATSRMSFLPLHVIDSNDFYVASFKILVRYLLRISYLTPLTPSCYQILMISMLLLSDFG